MSPRKYEMTQRAAKVEDTRRRIVDATLELHDAQGIRATSWDEIAARAGVGVGTVYRHFPSLAELVPACGVVTFELLGLPKPDDVARFFSGASSRRQRLERLVAELFGIYERGAGAIENVRRERNDPDLRMLEEAHERIERSLEALCVEALRPFSPSGGDLRTLRALTDIPVWRSLREQGFGGEQLKSVCVGAVEGALDGRRST